MIIQADEEGKKLINQLCNMAAKQATQEIGNVLASVKLLPKEDQPEDAPDETASE